MVPGRDPCYGGAVAVLVSGTWWDGDELHAVDEAGRHTAYDHDYFDASWAAEYERAVPVDQLQTVEVALRDLMAVADAAAVDRQLALGQRWTGQP